MNSKFFKVVGFSILLTFLLSMTTIGLAVGKPDFVESNGKVDVTTDEATISVTGGGNVPFFHIQPKGNDSASYQVKFSGMQEFVDKNNDGVLSNSESVPQSKVSFPSQGWEFSGFSTTNDSSNNIAMIEFNFTSTGSPTIEVRNHIDIAKGNEIKFDLAISDYTWTSTNNSAKLAINFQIAGGNLTQGSSANDLSFGDASFSSVSTATTNDGDISVSTQIDSGNSFSLVYGHFNQSFVHDPSFSAIAGSSSGNTTVTGASLELLPILSSLIVIGIVLARKRTKNY